MGSNFLVRGENQDLSNKSVLITKNPMEVKTNMTNVQLQYLASSKIFKLTTVTAAPAIATPNEGSP